MDSSLALLRIVRSPQQRARSCSGGDLCGTRDSVGRFTRPGEILATRGPTYAYPAYACRMPLLARLLHPTLPDGIRYTFAKRRSSMIDTWYLPVPMMLGRHAPRGDYRRRHNPAIVRGQGELPVLPSLQILYFRAGKLPHSARSYTAFRPTGRARIEIAQNIYVSPPPPRRTPPGTGQANREPPRPPPATADVQSIQVLPQPADPRPADAERR